MKEAELKEGRQVTLAEAEELVAGLQAELHRCASRCPAVVQHACRRIAAATRI